MVAADARTAVAFSIFPGGAHDAPECRKLLRRLGPLKERLRLRGGRNPAVGAGLRFRARCAAQENRANPWRHDWEIYKRRNEAERLFRRLKGFRRIFTRHDMRDALFLGCIVFVLIFDALVSVNTL